MKLKLFALMLALAFAVLSCASASAAQDSPSASLPVAADQPRPGLPAPSQPALKPRTNGYGLELHWGFVKDLKPGTDNPSLLLDMDGKVTISDNNPNTREGIHLISAQLFESGGKREHGRADEVILPPKDQAYTVEGTGVFYPWIAWKSTTTDDWDGVAVRFEWERGTDPTVTIETVRWSKSLPAAKLGTLTQTLTVGSAGQQLEIGRFFTLAYKVYDANLQWGYWKERDKNPDGPKQFAIWDGCAKLSVGGIRVVGANHFDTGSRYDQGRADQLMPRADLSPTLEWVASTLDDPRRPFEGESLALNLVVPQNAAATLTYKAGDYENAFALPPRFLDLHLLNQRDNEGHIVHLHLHWCWYKTPKDTGAGAGLAHLKDHQHK